MSILPCTCDGYIDADDVYRAVKPNTALVIVNHASNVTGALQELEPVCRACRLLGVPVLIDAAQSAGTVALDIGALKPDAVAMPAHKGLLGIQGCGVLYLGENMCVRPLRQGGTGSYSAVLEQPLELPDRYESGTLPTPAIASLNAGIHYVQTHFEQIITREAQHTTELWNALKTMDNVTLYGPEPSKPRVGVILFTINNMDAANTATVLWEEYGIACRSGLHCAPLIHKRLGTDKTGAVRLSVGAFTTQKEIADTIEAITMIAKDA